MEGLQQPEDGLNLLLHEFAHALWLEHKLMHHNYKVLEVAWIKQFEELATAEMTKLAQDEHHFFRRYAFSNMEEFFAVAVENFFERPEKFNQSVPALYAVLTNVFKQNPLQLTQRVQ